MDNFFRGAFRGLSWEDCWGEGLGKTLKNIISTLFRHCFSRVDIIPTLCLYVCPWTSCRHHVDLVFHVDIMSLSNIMLIGTSCRHQVSMFNQRLHVNIMSNIFSMSTSCRTINIMLLQTSCRHGISMLGDGIHVDIMSLTFFMSTSCPLVT